MSDRQTLVFRLHCRAFGSHTKRRNLRLFRWIELPMIVVPAWTLDSASSARSSVARNIRKLTGQEKEAWHEFISNGVQISRRVRRFESSLSQSLFRVESEWNKFSHLGRNILKFYFDRSLLGSLQVGKSLDGCCVAVHQEIQWNFKWFLPIATKMMRSASVLRLSLKFSELKVCSSSTSLLFNSAASVAARNYSQFQHKSVSFPNWVQRSKWTGIVINNFDEPRWVFVIGAPTLFTESGVKLD